MKLLFTCMLSILSFIVKADDFISGNKSVTPGAIETIPPIGRVGAVFMRIMQMLPGR